MFVIGGVVLIVSAIGGYLIFNPSKNKYDRDEIIDEITLIKKHLFEEYKKIGKMVENLSDIKELEKLKYDFNIDEFGKFLILKIEDEKEADEMLNLMNKASYYKSPYLYISIYGEKSNRNKPIAEIDISTENINTTTHIDYSYNEISGENQKIESVVWEGNKERFGAPGEYKITLKIKNNSGVWSDVTTKKITVTEVEGIKKIISSKEILFIIYNNGKVKYKAFHKNKLGLEINERFKDYSLAENVNEISMEYDHVLYITNDFFVKAAGSNEFGQLALSCKSDKRNFTKIWGIENAFKVETGFNFSGVLTKKKEMFLWGLNDCKQIKFKTSMYYDMPQKFTHIKNIEDFSLGRNYCLIKDSADKLYSFGSNDFGQLGDGRSVAEYEVQEVIVPEIDYFYAGDEFSFAVDKNGNLYGWGKNNRYQLGVQGSRVKTPIIINKVKDIIYITALESIVVAVTKLGEIFTWGVYFNKAGEVIEFTVPKKIKGANSVRGITICNEEVYVLTMENELFVSNHRLDLKKIEID